MNFTPYRKKTMMNNPVSNKHKTIKFALISLIFTLGACTQTSDLTQVAKNASSTSTVYDLNLGPKGGGTIDPKITVGQTVINFKQGDGVLLFNVNLSGTGSMSTKATYTYTSSADGTVTATGASPSPSPTVTPTPTVSPSASTNSISKLTNEIYINSTKYLLDIPAEKLSNNKYVLNLTGLKKGDIVSLSTQVYDNNSKVVGKESVQNKEVKEDVESVDLNISVNINISVEQKTEVNVSQSQVVVGPTINITIPTTAPTATITPPANNSQNNQNYPPPPPPPPINNPPLRSINNR